MFILLQFLPSPRFLWLSRRHLYFPKTEKLHFGGVFNHHNYSSDIWLLTNWKLSSGVHPTINSHLYSISSHLPLVCMCSSSCSKFPHLTLLSILVRLSFSHCQVSKVIIPFSFLQTLQQGLCLSIHSSLIFLFNFQHNSTLFSLVSLHTYFCFKTLKLIFFFTDCPLHTLSSQILPPINVHM